LTISTKYTFDGVQLTSANTCRVNKSMSDNNSTSTADFEFLNYNGIYSSTFTLGDEVIIYTGDTEPASTKIFLGVITNIELSGEDQVDDRIRLNCRDYGSVLQGIEVEPEVYNNTEISAIVLDLMTKYGPVGMTVNNVDATGVTIPRIVFKQISLFDIFVKLAQECDFFFYVDNDKDLHFERKNVISSLVTLDDSNVISANFTSDLDSMRNRIYVYGDRQLVKYPTETFTANGAGSVFTLAQTPYNIQVTNSGTQVLGDIYNTNNTVQSGVQYLVNIGSQQIIFVSGTDNGLIPTSGSLILADYWISTPIIKFAEDTNSISTYDIIRTQTIVDTSIKDPVYAQNLAFTTLANKSQPFVEGNLKVQGITNLTPGNTIVVNLPNEGVTNQTYDILEVSYDLDPETVLSEEHLSVKVSKRIGDITDVMKQMILDLKQLQANQIDDTGIISRLFGYNGSFGLQLEAWNVGTRAINNTFILSHPINGRIGSVTAPQPLLGDHRSGTIIVVSGP